MLTRTKIIAALVGTIGTVGVGGLASAQEFVPPPNGVIVAAPPVTVTAQAPVVTPVDYDDYYRGGYYGTPGVYYREGYWRREHERREWLRRRWWRWHHGYDRDRW